VKGFYGFTGGCRKSDVKPPARRNNPAWSEPDGKFVTAASAAIADGGLVCPDADVAERGQSGIVKAGRKCQVCHGDGEMVQHVHGVERTNL
jgi:hypothetical protein